MDPAATALTSGSAQRYQWLWRKSKALRVAMKRAGRVGSLACIALEP
ncbi:MAG TPA: hypothetical protein VFT50_08985 [Baekduia sp.]|nr:hypothetical protein [Baekduia sp.]